MPANRWIPVVLVALAIAWIAGGFAQGPGAAAEQPLRVREQTIELVAPGPRGPQYGHITMFAIDEPGADMDARLAEGKAAMLARFPGASELDPGAVSAQFRLFGVRWPNPSASWQYNPAGVTTAMPAAAALNAIRAGSEGWNNAGGSGFHFDYLGETTTVTGCNGVPEDGNRDDQNIVGWGHIVGGFLGFSCYWNSPTLVQNTPYFTTTEFDIVLEPTASYSATTLQALAMHEFGHAMGLAHTEPGLCPGQAMCAGNDALTFTSPRPDDINGVIALYGVDPGSPIIPPGPRPYKARAVGVAKD